MKYVYVLGGGRGSSGLSQENFEMKRYKSCKSVQIWIIHQRKRFYLRSCLCQSDSASLSFLVFYIQRHELYIKGNSLHVIEEKHI